MKCFQHADSQSIDKNLSPSTMNLAALEDESRTILYDRSNILGRGGFAIVYSGTLDGNPVAVKRIQRDVVANESNKREEEALRRLDHPNVINLLHVEEDDDFK